MQAYFAAVDDYSSARAWKLGGKSIGSSDAACVDEFNGTAENTAAIISVSSDEVTAQLVASPTDGTVKDHGGVYTGCRPFPQPSTGPDLS
jgi:hypothetical protein